MPSRFLPVVLAGLWMGYGIGLSTVLAQTPTQAEQIAFFEKHIRPVLVKECYSCHSADSKDIEGGLTLDTREGIRKGGDTGPAVVPGNVRRSLLIKALKQTDDNLQMPPDKKLPAEVISQFEKWVALGAADPRDGKAKVADKYEIDIEKGRQFWAFQPPKKVAPPQTKQAGWPHSTIDRFLLAELEAKGLKPVADADAETLVRRLFFDLIGLPPSPENIEKFKKEYMVAPQATVGNAVDKLLASPRFGERWGRHWLDVARYGESTGQAANFAYPHAWRYRDWVIDAFNKDLPYDQFIRAQLAGDILSVDTYKQRADLMVATGFLAVGPKSVSERNRRQFQMDVVDEQIDATFQAFQALTVACARCHDHRFDPIPQSDYYALAGIFQSTETCYGTIRQIQSNHPSRLLELPPDAAPAHAVAPLSASRRESIERQIAELREQMANITNREDFIRRIFIGSRVSQLQSQLEQYTSAGQPKALAMGVQEGRLISDSPIYTRGEIDQPGERVPRGFPQVLTTSQPNISYRNSGRLELANWIASPENPLTARVMVNRIWLHLMGQGLVSTPDNFGASGQRPSHPELLDYLAVSFMENGWSVKELIRSIVLSRAYQMSSEFDHDNYEIDPENVYVWRMPKRRLEAEALRDAILKLGGNLDRERPNGSVVAQTGEGRVRPNFGGDPATTDNHRSVYLPIVRDQIPEMLTIFDFPDPSLIMGERPTTTIPAQSLFMMNNSFVIRQADSLGSQLLLESRDDKERIRRAYQLCYSRSPSDTEINAALKFLGDYGKSHSIRQTWAAFCQALFASAEFAER